MFFADTAARAEHAGARVFVRHDEKLRGKGYALAHAFERLVSDNDAIVVVDTADSLVFRLLYNNLRQAYEPALEALAPLVSTRAPRGSAEDSVTDASAQAPRTPDTAGNTTDKVENHTAHTNLTLLLIEDDPSIREVTAIGLRAAGFEVDTAPDGVAGVEKWRKAQPDLVIWPENSLDRDVRTDDGQELLVREQRVRGATGAESLRRQKALEPGSRLNTTAASA